MPPPLAQRIDRDGRAGCARILADAAYLGRSRAGHGAGGGSTCAMIGQGYELEVALPPHLPPAQARCRAGPRLFADGLCAPSSRQSFARRGRSRSWQLEGRDPGPGADGGPAHYALRPRRRAAWPARSRAERPAWFAGRAGGIRTRRSYDRYRAASRATRWSKGPALVEENANPPACSAHGGHPPRSTQQGQSRHRRRRGARVMSHTTGSRSASYWDRLISIGDETHPGVWCARSFSTNVRESYDLSCVLFDRQAAGRSRRAPTACPRSPAPPRRRCAG
jgi:hypothetical protein